MDHSSFTVSDFSKRESKLLVKDNGIIAGVAFAKMIFNYVDPT
jgi:nicotinate-nucleotide pyrophosphorylase (carboxylating)